MTSYSSFAKVFSLSQQSANFEWFMPKINFQVGMKSHFFDGRGRRNKEHENFNEWWWKQAQEFSVKVFTIHMISFYVCYRYKAWEDGKL